LVLDDLGSQIAPQSSVDQSDSLSRRNIVIHLSPEERQAGVLMHAAGLRSPFEEFRPQELIDLVRRRVKLRKQIQLCVIAGSPPSEATGFSLACAAVLLLWPRTVAQADTGADRVTRSGPTRFLAEHGLAAVGQLAVSIVSLVAQRAIAEAVRRIPRSRERVSPPRDPERVVYLFPVAGTASAIGGAATHANEVIRAFRRKGVIVTPLTTNEMFTQNAWGDARDVGWIEARIPKPARAVPASAAFAGDLALARSALRAARGADMIYQRHFRFSIVGALLSKLTRTPLFLEFNGRGDFMVSDPPPFVSLRRLCEDVSFRMAARVVVVSDVERRRLVGEGVRSDRIIVSPNGVDPARFGSGGGSAIRRGLGLGRSERVIGFLGTFGPWHGATTLARAFAALAPEVSNARLLLVGDGAERPAVERLLALHGVADRTILVGRVPSGQVPAYLDACDVLVSPHVRLPDGEAFFGSPTKLFEYMAAAKPIVASRLGQIADVLEDGETALLTTPGDVDELTAAVSRLLADPRLARRIARRAREVAQSLHTWDDNVSRVIDGYRNLLGTEVA
jgi:glycosyltransferase involved in cell wall biosynthesis